jgi:hypothetical protein
MSHAAQCDCKEQNKVEPTIHWERPHSMAYGYDFMYEMFNQGLNIDHLESEDCPSEDESDATSLAPHHLSNSVSSSESEYDESEYGKFEEDPWDDSKFLTYQCNSVKVSHIPSEPTINPHDYEDESDNTAGLCIHCVTLSKENIYQPKSIHDDTVDLKLFKIACEVPEVTFNTSTFKDISAQDLKLLQSRINTLSATATSALPPSLVL